MRTKAGVTARKPQAAQAAMAQRLHYVFRVRLSQVPEWQGLVSAVFGVGFWGAPAKGPNRFSNFVPQHREKSRPGMREGRSTPLRFTASCWEYLLTITPSCRATTCTGISGAGSTDGFVQIEKPSCRFPNPPKGQLLSVIVQAFASGSKYNCFCQGVVKGRNILVISGGPI